MARFKDVNSDLAESSRRGLARRHHKHDALRLNGGHSSSGEHRRAFSSGSLTPSSSIGAASGTYSASLPSGAATPRCGAGIDATASQASSYNSLTRRIAELETAIQRYRKLLRNSRQMVSEVKTELYEADMASQEVGSSPSRTIHLEQVRRKISSIVDGDIGKAAAVQEKVENSIKLHKELSSKLRSTSATLEVEAVRASCESLRSRLGEVKVGIESARSRVAKMASITAGFPFPSLQPQAVHRLLRSFAVVLLPQLEALEKIALQDQRIAEATVISFLQAAKDAAPQTDKTQPQTRLGMSAARAGASNKAKKRPQSFRPKDAPSGASQAFGNTAETGLETVSSSNQPYAAEAESWHVSSSNQPHALEAESEHVSSSNQPLEPLSFIDDENVF